MKKKLQKVRIELYRVRVSRNMKLYEVAEKLGITSNRLCKILHGSLKIRTEEKRVLSKFIGIPQKDLFQKETFNAN